MLTSGEVTLLAGFALASCTQRVIAFSPDPPPAFDLATLDDADAGRPAPSECVLEFSVGDWHNCAVLADHSLWCWGQTLREAIAGVGPGTPMPFEVTALHGHAVSVAVGTGHACALKDDGSVWCWGDNRASELGSTVLGGFVDDPVRIDGLPSAARQLAVAATSSLAVLEDGSLWSWGSGVTLGIGGDEAPTGKPRPVTGTGHDVTSVSARWNNACLVRQGGSVSCWGLNGFGALGIGEPTPDVRQTIPTEVAALGGTTDRLSVGYDEICSLSIGASVACSGQSRLGPPDDRPFPVPVPGLGDGIVQVAPGQVMSCALDRDQTGWCWGDPADGIPGLERHPWGRALAVVTHATSLALGKASACAKGKSGRLYCWGFNSTGQLGNGRVSLWEPLSQDTLAVQLPCP